MIPLFVAHGDADLTIPYIRAFASYEFLTEKLGTMSLPATTLDEWCGQYDGKKAGPGAVFCPYHDAGHGENPKELVDLTRWLKIVLRDWSIIHRFWCVLACDWFDQTVDLDIFMNIVLHMYPNLRA